ncbi:MAG: DUF4215 domain-containing protein [Candidatus Pacebacteria bacterium]|nr:DUF4215 domain-containing protein [Candidatus Paceibacterota bacterium]
MKNIDLKKLLTQFLIATFFVGTIALAAWNAPTAVPPGNNVSGPINTSSNPQSKGGSRSFRGSLLDVAQTFSANVLYVIQNMTVENQVTVSALTSDQGVWTSGLRPVCIDTSNKLVICDAQCGNSYIEKAEQCDDGNTANGDGCSSICLIE